MNLGMIKMKKKNTNKFLYLIINTIIFIILNFLIIKGLNFINEKVLVKLVENYQILYLIFYNLIWLIINILELIIVNKITKRIRLHLKDVNIVKNINIIIFSIIIGFLNINKINILMHYNISVICLSLILHITIIWYLNVYLFEKKYKCDRLKLDLLSLIISTVLMFTIVFMNEYITYEKTTVDCVRSNNDIVNIRVGKYGVENIKSNGEFISEEELMNYNLELLIKFADNYNKYDSEEEVIKANMDIVYLYEKEQKSSCKKH